ncbi:MAG: prephenate dehydratase [bacterium]
MKKENRQLKTFRSTIDRIDTQIVKLLNERSRAVLGVKAVKNSGSRQFYVPHREMEVYRKTAAANQGPFPAEGLKAVFREIMSGSLAMESPLKVAYFGPPGSNTHIAAVRKFGHSTFFESMPAIKDVFQEVERGRAQYGVVPVENSTEGIVNHTLDLFVDSDLKICSEISIPISYMLMSQSGRASQVKVVYSHPQALAQTRLWMETHLPDVKTQEVTNTAKAAQLASQNKNCAAIATEMAARLYRLKPIANRIEDLADNQTRFLIIGQTQAEPTGRDRTSIMVSIKDKVGALYALLTPFEKKGISLTNIESRPSRKKVWDYYFFIDFAGHVNDRMVQKTLAEIEKAALTVKVLGSYPRADG